MDLFKQIMSWMFLLSWVQVTGTDGFLIKNVRLEKCVHASAHETEKVRLAECNPHSPQHQWSWDAATRAIINLKTLQCLTVHRPQEFALAQLEPCGQSMHQAWVCSRKGHLTLPGLGLHLSTEAGGHKAFLSQGKDKFSRWKTMTDEILCAAELAAEAPTEEPADTLLWTPESKAFVLPETLAHPADSTATSPTTTLQNDPMISSTLPNSEEISLETGQERHTHNKKQAGNSKKTAGSRHPGTSWKTVMLVLCPLAFILGLTILALNIHYNKKKKKMLSVLKSRSEKSCKVGHEEHLPLPGPARTVPKRQIIPGSPSPSLKHGEILIEWKDGTITPLFDNMNYQIC